MAQEELHQTLVRVQGECTRAKKKLTESFDRGERMKEIALNREKVRVVSIPCNCEALEILFFVLVFSTHVYRNVVCVKCKAW